MRCDCKKCDKGSGYILMFLSVVALILSMVVSIFNVELYLAGTQWILVSILLAVYASVAFKKSCD